MLEVTLTLVFFLVGIGVVWKVTTLKPKPVLPIVKKLAEDGSGLTALERGVMEKTERVMQKAKELGLADIEAELRKDESRHDVNGSDTMRAIGRKVATITNAARKI
jgi:hypothetical protein